MRSISVGRLGEKYYLMIVMDGIDFLWAQICKVRTNPEDLMREALHSAYVAHDETDQLSYRQFRMQLMVTDEDGDVPVDFNTARSHAICQGA